MLVPTRDTAQTFPFFEGPFAPMHGRRTKLHFDSWLRTEIEIFGGLARVADIWTGKDQPKTADILDVVNRNYDQPESTFTKDPADNMLKLLAFSASASVRRNLRLPQSKRDYGVDTAASWLHVAVANLRMLAQQQAGLVTVVGTEPQSGFPVVSAGDTWPAPATQVAGGGAAAAAPTRTDTMSEPQQIIAEAAATAAPRAKSAKSTQDIHQELPERLEKVISQGIAPSRNQAISSNDHHAFIRRHDKWRESVKEWKLLSARERPNATAPGPEPLCPGSREYVRVLNAWKSEHAAWEATAKSRKAPEPLWPPQLGPPPRKNREKTEGKILREQREKQKAFDKAEQGPARQVTREEMRERKVEVGKGKSQVKDRPGKDFAHARPTAPIRRGPIQTQGRLRFDPDGTPHILARIYNEPPHEERLAIRELRRAQSLRDRERTYEVGPTDESRQGIDKAISSLSFNIGGVTEKQLWKLAAYVKDISVLNVIAPCLTEYIAQWPVLPLLLILTMAAAEEATKLVIGAWTFALIEAAIKLATACYCWNTRGRVLGTLRTRAAAHHLLSASTGVDPDLKGGTDEVARVKMWAPSPSSSGVANVLVGTAISIILHPWIGSLPFFVAVAVHAMWNVAMAAARDAENMLMIFAAVFNLYGFITDTFQIDAPKIPDVIVAGCSAVEEEVCKAYSFWPVVITEVAFKSWVGASIWNLSVCIWVHITFAMPSLIYGVSFESVAFSVLLHMLWNLHVATAYMSIASLLTNFPTHVFHVPDVFQPLVADISTILNMRPPAYDSSDTIERICGKNRTLSYTNRGGLVYKDEHPLVTAVLGGVWRKIVIGKPFMPNNVNISAADRKNVTEKSTYIVHPVTEAEVHFPGLQWRFWRTFGWYPIEMTGNLNLASLLAWPNIHYGKTHEQRTAAFLNTGGNNAHINDCLDQERTITARFHASLSAYLTFNEPLNQVSPDVSFMGFLLTPFCGNLVPTSMRTSGRDETRVSSTAVHWESTGLKLQNGKVVKDPADTPQSTTTSATNSQASSSESATQKSNPQQVAGGGAAATSSGTQRRSRDPSSESADQQPLSNNGSTTGRNRKQRKKRSGATSTAQANLASSAVPTSQRNRSSNPSSTTNRNTHASSTPTAQSQSLSSALCSLTSTQPCSNTGASSKVKLQMYAHGTFIMCCAVDASLKLTFQVWSAIIEAILQNFSTRFVSILLNLALCLGACASFCVIITVVSAAWSLRALKQFCHLLSCQEPQTPPPAMASSTSYSSPTSSSPPNTRNLDTPRSRASSASSEGASREMMGYRRLRRTSMSAQSQTSDSDSSSRTTSSTARPRSAGSLSLPLALMSLRQNRSNAWWTSSAYPPGTSTQDLLFTPGSCEPKP